MEATNPSYTSSTREWQVLLECAATQPDSLRLERLLVQTDWPALLELMEHHGVTAHVALRLKELEDRIVPAEIKRKLGELHRAQLFSALRMTAELFHLVDRFASRGIGLLAIKGPALAMQAYDDPAMRQYGDLDFLVRQKEIHSATQLMMEDGFEAAIPLHAIVAGKIPGQYFFSRRESNLIVELHNEQTLRYFPKKLPLEKYFQRQTKIKIDAREVPTLAVEDTLVQICIHGSKHFWDRLMWIADVAALVSRRGNIDWRRLADSAEEVGAQRMVHTGLWLAHELLKTPLSEEIAQAIQNDKVTAQLTKQVTGWLTITDGGSLNLRERAFFRMRMRGESLVSGAGYLLRLSFSPTEEDWAGDSEKKQGHFREIITRPFRLARKHGRRDKS